jgi:hypothetical protein
MAQANADLPESGTPTKNESIVCHPSALAPAARRSLFILALDHRASFAEVLRIELTGSAITSSPGCVRRRT